jgi:hypothetical protein
MGNPVSPSWFVAWWTINVSREAFQLAAVEADEEAPGRRLHAICGAVRRPNTPSYPQSHPVCFGVTWVTRARPMLEPNPVAVGEGSTPRAVPGGGWVEEQCLSHVRTF